MAAESWHAIDDYFDNKLLPLDEVLESVLKGNANAGLPPYDVTPLQGQLLHLLARMNSARRILEVGTLGGYSSILLARALPSDGRLVTLEVEPHHAAVAKENFERAGCSDKIEIVVGNAADSMAKLYARNTEPFDFFFIDADKQNNPTYFEWAMKLGRPRAVIVIDNVVRNGQVIAADSDDPGVVGIRNVVELIRSSDNFVATAIQTVGVKGHDGFIVGMVQ